MSEALSTLARLRQREMTFAAFRWWLYSTVVWLFLVVATGAVVRLSGSGLGCDNWPRCGELPVPTEAKTYHPVIEFSNRMLALGAIVFSIVTWLVARRTKGLPRWVVRASGVVALATVAQIPLGGVTVLTGLHPIAVMSHFLLTIAVLGLALHLVLEIRREEHGAVEPWVPGWVRRGALFMVVAGTGLVVTGAFATASGPHPGASNEVRRLFTVEGTVYVHVRATAIYGVTFAILIATLVWQRRRSPRLLLSALGLLALLAGQMALGEVQYNDGLPAWQVAIHVAVAGIVWGWTFWLVGAIWRPSQLDTRPLPGRIGTLLGSGSASGARA